MNISRKVGFLILLGTLGFIFAGGSNNAFADDNTADNVTLSVEVSCSMTKTLNSEHTKEVALGVYENNIGESTFKTYCNDAGGYAVYAVGYSDNTFGNNTLVPENVPAANSIATGTATSGNTSNWAMKLSAVSGTYAPTIATGFSDYHAVPDDYTKVVSLNSNTDFSIGSSFKTTYAAYVAQGQIADTYNGVVKYTLVYPASEAAPIESISQVIYMQDFATMSEVEKTAVINSMNYDTTYGVVDTRDNQTYSIAKLKDGNIWMIDNLDLGRTDLSVDLTSTNTNIATTVAASTFNGWKKTSGTNTYTSGEFINVDGADPTSGTEYGTLYNYYVVSAGTITGSNNVNNATYDICPAGWRLPTGGPYGDFEALYSEYNSSSLMIAPLENSGGAFARAGYFDNGVPVGQNSDGYYWSSTQSAGTSIYDLGLNAAGFHPEYNTPRNSGYAIRCVLKDTKTISSFTNLQELRTLTAEMKETVLASMEYDTTYDLTDDRDDKTYAVAKMRDDYIWMIDNLDLGRTNLSNNLTKHNTNLLTTVTASTFNGWKKTSGSATYDAGEFISLDGSDSVAGISYGTLYNFYAASAGTISGSTNTKNATYDICPAGWKIPVSANISGDFYRLYTYYNSIALMRAPVEESGASFAFAGRFYSSNTPSNQGTTGKYWSSKRCADYAMCSMDISESSITFVSGISRTAGSSIRCMLK